MIEVVLYYAITDKLRIHEMPLPSNQTSVTINNIKADDLSNMEVNVWRHEGVIIKLHII